MTEEETKFLMFKASAAYPYLEIEDETLAVWIERLAPIPFNRGLANLDRHIDTNDFFPKIADIIRQDREFMNDHEQLKLQTVERFALLEAWATEDKPPPPGYWDNVRAKLAGDDT